ncbi:hypothetical protein GIB67_022605 [Kingdonia uniflora]|uniref:Pseudouridine synthase I TruA alpha/beta domain-containing protein n=1 Tax=Kingdonia uniflora TaxID=39325 RepID=A0A7J7P8E7_9MAGN|nr:hypothetical protein GIB67_022605 [Kingdonia uniflora]
MEERQVDPHPNTLDPPIDSSNGGNPLITNLHSQLNSLQNKVKELELENATLLSLISSCQCGMATGKSDSSISRGHDVAEERMNVSKCCDAIKQVSVSGFGEDVNGDDATGGEGTLSLVPMKKKKSREISLGFNIVPHQSKRYVALKVLYFGQRFYGFASEAQMDPTVESEIFDALKKTRLLVGNKEESQYSRCGRTDKGVSSVGQVISLYLRSKLKDSAGRAHNEEISPENIDALFLRNEEIDYVRVLNGVLPKDIRVISWCPAPVKFHASSCTGTEMLTVPLVITAMETPIWCLIRAPYPPLLLSSEPFQLSMVTRESGGSHLHLISWFSCLSREYKYLFWKENLDIVAMEMAGKKFVGEHDFRNFCKMDVVNVHNYRRNVTSFGISSCSVRSEDNQLWAMTINGSAFLWHQVRCMVAVLFMIGRGLEPPTVIDALLDTNRTPRKPQYTMAPELPLVLQSCNFESLRFTCSPDAGAALLQHLQNEIKTYNLQAAIFQEALNSCLSTTIDGNSFTRGKKKAVHVPLASRPTERVKTRAQFYAWYLELTLPERKHSADLD